jgi:hypothetical protein
MSEHVLDPELHETEQLDTGRRHHHGIDEQLILTALRADQVIDRQDDGEPVELITFGTVRETCPQCEQHHLKLVLRQRRVRLAHLFCTECQGCFDAHYANGVSALTI